MLRGLFFFGLGLILRRGNSAYSSGLTLEVSVSCEFILGPEPCSISRYLTAESDPKPRYPTEGSSSMPGYPTEDSVPDTPILFLEAYPRSKRGFGIIFIFFRYCRDSPLLEHYYSLFDIWFNIKLKHKTTNNVLQTNMNSPYNSCRSS